MKKYFFIYLIAAYFIFNGCSNLYQTASNLANDFNFNSTLLYNLLVQLGYLITGFGLILKKGWGRYFAILFGVISVFQGASALIVYFFRPPPELYKPSSYLDLLSSGITKLTIYGPILLYLLRKKTKTLFNENIAALGVIGVFLCFWSVYAQYEPYGHGLVSGILLVVGLAIINSANQQRKKFLVNL